MSFYVICRSLFLWPQHIPGSSSPLFATQFYKYLFMRIWIISIGKIFGGVFLFRCCCAEQSEMLSSFWGCLMTRNSDGLWSVFDVVVKRGNSTLSRDFRWNISLDYRKLERNKKQFRKCLKGINKRISREGVVLSICLVFAYQICIVLQQKHLIKERILKSWGKKEIAPQKASTNNFLPLLTSNVEHLSRKKLINLLLTVCIRIFHYFADRLFIQNFVKAAALVFVVFLRLGRILQ